MGGRDTGRKEGHGASRCTIREVDPCEPASAKAVHAQMMHKRPLLKEPIDLSAEASLDTQSATTKAHRREEETPAAGVGIDSLAIFQGSASVTLSPVWAFLSPGTERLLRCAGTYSTEYIFIIVGRLCGWNCAVLHGGFETYHNYIL